MDGECQEARKRGVVGEDAPLESGVAMSPAWSREMPEDVEGEGEGKRWRHRMFTASDDKHTQSHGIGTKGRSARQVLCRETHQTVAWLGGMSMSHLAQCADKEEPWHDDT